MKIDPDKIQGKAFTGIDVNLTGFGVCTITQDRIRTKFISVVKQVSNIDKMFPEWVRLTQSFYEYLCETCDGFWNFACIEDPTGMSAGYITKKGKFKSAWQTADILNRLTGMLAIVLIGNNFQCKFPSSVIWKKATVGDGKADKKTVQLEMSKVLYGEDIDRILINNHHIADACGLAYYGYLEHVNGR